MKPHDCTEPQQPCRLCESRIAAREWERDRPADPHEEWR